jgi:hypothetical protein
MKGLKRTTNGGLVKKHYHIVYVDSDSGFGRCGVADGHVHEIEYINPQPEQTDPNTGQVIQEATNGYFIVHPAEDGHTHDRIINYQVKPLEAPGTEEEIIKETLELVRNAYALEKESLESGRTALEFVRGKQWEPSLKHRIEAEGRAALTVNVTAKYVNEIVGHEIQNRTDIRYVPQEDGDQIVADLLNILTKQLLNQCFFDREKTKTFRQSVITGRGIFNLFLDTSRNLEGEIKIESYPCDEFKAGPHEKEDLSDAEYIVKDKYFSIGKLAQVFEEKADEIRTKFGIISDFGLSNEQVGSLKQRDYRSEISGNEIYPLTMDGVKLVDIARKEALVIEVWRKIYVKIPIAVNPDYSCYQNIFGWEKADIEAVSTIKGFQVVKRPGTKFRITKIGCGVVLQDDYCVDLPVDDFFCVPVYANKDGRHFWGKVHDVLDIQRGANKRYSQGIDIGNRMASYGWFYDDDTFPENEVENFKRNSSTPGFTQKVNNTNKLPAKVEGSKFPAEIVQLMDLDMKFVGELMNISVGARGANTSAQALLQEQKIRLTGNEYLFDGLSHALVKIGRLLIKMIQKYYTPDRIYRIVRNAAAKKDAMIAGKPFSSYSEEQLIYLLETADLDQYDVEIAEAPNSPAVRLTIQSIIGDLMNKGAPIPPQVPIRLSDLPEDEKQKLLQDIQSQQDAQAESAKETRKGEVEKTLIAQGYLPPDIAQEFGIQAPGNPGIPQSGTPPTEDFQNNLGNQPLAEFRG